MIEARFVPLTLWPREKTRSRQCARFRANYQDTLSLLETELRKLSARNIRIHLALEARDIRNDGWPRADARQPQFSGVIVSFDSRFGAKSFLCDRYTQWRDNLRAIALSLEALRAVDRHGVTGSGEQYGGFAALPDANSSTVGSDDVSTPEGASAFLARYAKAIEPAQGAASLARAIQQNSAVFQTAYREAAKALHPDNGGSTAAFQRLQEARATLQKYHDARLGAAAVRRT